MYISFRTGLFAAGSVLFIGTPARASQIVCTAYDGTNHTDTQTSACGAASQSNPTQTVINTVSIPVSQDVSVDVFDAFTTLENINANVSGTLGASHGFVSYSASNTPPSYSYTSTYSLFDANGFTLKDENGDPQIVHFSLTDPNPLSVGGQAVVQIDWHDGITLFDPGALPGTLLSFNISAPMQASLSSNDCTRGNAIASNVFEVDNAVVLHGETFFGGTTISLAGTFGNACDPTRSGSISSTFQAPVGSVLYLSGSFKLVAAGSGDGFSATADASNTGHYNLDLLTPNAYYTDENGSRNGFASAQQSSGVPEPGTLGMLCSGLAAMRFAKGKRKRV